MKVNDFNSSERICYPLNRDLAADSGRNAYAVWGAAHINFAALSASDLPPRSRLFLPTVPNRDASAW